MLFASVVTLMVYDWPWVKFAVVLPLAGKTVIAPLAPLLQLGSELLKPVPAMATEFINWPALHAPPPKFAPMQYWAFELK